jgi:prepilin-type N-terminal cleavage/methylation domain-containing protein
MIKRIHSSSGFTLVELLVAMVVMGLLAFTTVDLLREQHQVTVRQNNGMVVTQNARAGLDMLVRELRNAGYDPHRLANAGFVVTGVSDIAWTADLNGDGDVADSDETVRYYFDADLGALVRDVGGVATLVADGVSSVTFRYLDGDLQTVTVDDSIELIHIQLTYTTPEGVLEGNLESQVAVRNQLYKGKKNFVTLCHDPTGLNQTRDVNARQLQSHMSHGDYLGTCTASSGAGDDGGGWGGWGAGGCGDDDDSECDDD